MSILLIEAVLQYLWIDLVFYFFVWLINIKNIQAVEESLLDIAQMINGQKKGILQRLKKSSSPHHTAILSATIATLGKIGTANSEAFLKKMTGAKTAQAEAARKAVESLRRRYAKQKAGAPVTS